MFRFDFNTKDINLQKIALEQVSHKTNLVLYFSLMLMASVVYLSQMMKMPGPILALLISIPTVISLLGVAAFRSLEDVYMESLKNEIRLHRTLDSFMKSGKLLDSLKEDGIDWFISEVRNIHGIKLSKKDFFTDCD